MIEMVKTTNQNAADYVVLLNRSYTIEEFINASLKENSLKYQTFNIGSIFSTFSEEYQNKRKIKSLPNNLLTKTVKSVLANKNDDGIVYIIKL